jgi:hypothetical protein
MNFLIVLSVWFALAIVISIVLCKIFNIDKMD